MPYIVKGNCVFKKDTGAKVGCTKGSVNKYLAALHTNVDESKDNLLKGGKGDKIRNINDLYIYWQTKLLKTVGAYSKSLKKELQHEIDLGFKIESEHTSDPEKQKEILFDHLVEDKNYYTKPKPKNWAEKEINAEKSGGITEGKLFIKRLLRQHIHD